MTLDTHTNTNIGKMTKPGPLLNGTSDGIAGTALSNYYRALLPLLRNIGRQDNFVLGYLS